MSSSQKELYWQKQMQIQINKYLDTLRFHSYTRPARVHTGSHGLTGVHSYTRHTRAHTGSLGFTPTRGPYGFTRAHTGSLGFTPTRGPHGFTRVHWSSLLHAVCSRLLKRLTLMFVSVVFVKLDRWKKALLCEPSYFHNFCSRGFSVLRGFGYVLLSNREQMLIIQSQACFVHSLLTGTF